MNTNKNVFKIVRGRPNAGHEVRGRGSELKLGGSLGLICGVEGTSHSNVKESKKDMILSYLTAHIKSK